MLGATLGVSAALTRDVPLPLNRGINCLAQSHFMVSLTPSAMLSHGQALSSFLSTHRTLAP
ncbi:hypothetical protein GCM10011504_50480 [Siccirubricoccus deserti]|nr:hypothetical protein GCM10011504_50480 [Siccirubricoccus deserti]